MADLEDVVAAAWCRAASNVEVHGADLPPATSVLGARYRAYARAVLADLDGVGVLQVPEPGPRTWTVPTVDADTVTDRLGAVWQRRSDGSWWCPAEPQRPAFRDAAGLLVTFGPLTEVQPNTAKTNPNPQPEEGSPWV